MFPAATSFKKRTATDDTDLSSLVASMQGRDLQCCDILQLFDALPKNPSPRQSGGQGEAFSAGSFVHGGVVGIHKNTIEYASAVQLICKFLSTRMKGRPFTSFTILDQCQSSLHIDSNNEPDSWNLIVPLSKFVGGGVWYEDEHGTMRCPSDPSLLGSLLKVDSGPQWLSATRHKHCTLPWTGRRCVLVAFSTRFCDHLKAHDVCVLRDCGFSLATSITTGELNPFQPARVPCLQDMLVLELCCGDAQICCACSRVGFQVLALDARPLSSSRVRVVKFDLTDLDVLDGLQQMILHDAARIAMLWVRVPTGTTARCRERPVPSLQKKGIKLPAPFRNKAEPDGLLHLRGVAKRKLETANLVFEALCGLVTKAARAGVRCVLENPTDSLFWFTTWFRSLESLSPASYWTSFPLCMHGGSRPKQVSLWSNSIFLAPLAAACPGESANHCHKPWVPGFRQGRHPAVSVGSYLPELLCNRVAGLLRSALAKEKVSDDPSLPAAVQRHAPATDRLVLGLQPNRAPGLLPEFGYFVHVVQPVAASEPPAPSSGRLLSRHLSTWGEVQAEKRLANVGLQCLIDNPLPSLPVEVFRFGVPLSPDKFLKRAVEVGHPHAFASNLEPTLKDVVAENISGDPLALVKTRLRFVAKWSARAKELEASERKLQDSLPEHVGKILKGKRLLLWKEMILEYDLPDKALIDDMLAGFPLSGWLPKSGAFPSHVRRPEFSVETLRHLAEGLNKATLRKMALRQDSELEEATWRETLAELQHGWIWEAPEAEEGLKVYARRFGLSQHGKIRVIDDCSCCGLNATVGTVEKFVVHAIDRMASMLAYALQVSTDTNVSLCGRTYDLKSAYKQFPVACKDRDFVRMFVNCPDQERPCAVGLNALPFGAIGSVAAFLRVSASAWMLGVIALRIVWTAFFDDYSVISKTSLKKNVGQAVEALFSLLGLTYATEGKKAPEFSAAFTMLGLVVDVSKFGEGSIQIGHTQKRVDELTTSLGQVLEADRLSAKESERLRGRRNFFEGYAFGRAPAQAVKVVDGQARAGLLKFRLTDEASSALKILIARLGSARPLEINLKSCKTWYLFTDGAFENGVGSVGAVLYDEAGAVKAVFGAKAPDSFMSQVLAYSKNPIYELEILPVLLCLCGDRSCATAKWFHTSTTRLPK